MPNFLRLLFLIGLFAAAPALADETRGTAEEAQAMVAKAIADYDAHGEAVFAAINGRDKAYVDRDLYVFIADPNHIIVAHGVDPTRIGEDLSAIVDSAGAAFGKTMVESATPEGVWVDYLWRDPLTGEELAKSSWVVRHDGYLFGCGIYKP